MHGNQRGLPKSLLLVLCAAVAGCQITIDQPFGSHTSFGGMVAGDEPQAVLVGRDVLTGGGSATDAVVAMAFAMTATLPSQVGLGSSGLCLAYDHGKKGVEAIDFTPRQTSNAAGGIVPGLPRGLFLLHATRGVKRWNELVSVAAGMAEHGVPASRAFIRQLEPAAATVLADPLAATVFEREDGKPLQEGDILRNPQLATALGRMALHGVGEFYESAWSREFVQAAHQVNAAFTTRDMRDFIPQRANSAMVPYNHEEANFAPTALGPVEANVWTRLTDDSAYEDATPDARPKLVAQAFAHAISHSNEAGAAAGAGVVAVDHTSSAVVCEFTLNRAFGTARMVPGFGTYLAAPAPNGGPAIGPMLVVNPHSDELRFAAAAAGGLAGAVATIRTAAATLLADQALPDAIAAHPGAADLAGRVEAVRCESGSPDISKCIAVTDPRGFGLAQTMAGP